MINLILLFIATFNPSLAQDSHCEYFKYCGSAGSPTKSSSQSYPSTGSSSSFNPSTISRIKGVGVETLLQPSNPVGFSLASGTGKFGGALISPNLENGFFGNRSIELDPIYLQRRKNKKRYKSNKLNLALGAGLVSKKNFTLDLGIAAKRHSEIKKINPGVGISVGVYSMTFGVAYYKDDVKLHFEDYINPRTRQSYHSQYGAPTHQESFNVLTYSAGFKWGGLAVDFGRIQTEHDFYKPMGTYITIMSAAYNYKKFLINLAYRTESSPHPYEKNGELMEDPNKSDMYFGVQYLLNRHLVFGLGYNTFLLNEVSGTVTIYL